MNDYKKAILDLAKDCSVEYMTASKTITSRSCYLFGMVMKPEDSDDLAVVNLRNGETVLDDILIGHATKYARTPEMPNTPVYFNRGLYVEISGKVTGVFIQYLEE